MAAHGAAGQASLRKGPATRVQPGRRGLSAYKFYLPDEPITPNVTVLGDPTPEPIQQQIHRILQAGMPLTLPDRVIQTMFERRQAGQIQPYVEGHWRPGKVFYPPKPPETRE